MGHFAFRDPPHYKAYHSMKLSLGVYAPPSSPAAYNAYRFAQAVTESSNEIYKIFFYFDGVYNGNSLATPPSDEVNLPEAWAELANDHQVELCVCIAAGIRRGVLDSDEATRNHKHCANLNEKFQIVGLGQLLDAAVKSDRFVTFG